MINRGVIALAAAVLSAGPALAGPCATAGETSSRVVKLDYNKDTVGYVTWAYALDPVLIPPVIERAGAPVTCVRAEFQAGGETYVLTGENGELPPRRAMPANAGKPSLFLVPVRDLRKEVGERLGVDVPYQAGATFVLIRLDARFATAVRIYKKMPTDEVLLADFAEVLAGGGQAFATMERPAGKVGIVLSAPRK